MRYERSVYSVFVVFLLCFSLKCSDFHKPCQLFRQSTCHLAAVLVVYTKKHRILWIPSYIRQTAEQSNCRCSFAPKNWFRNVAQQCRQNARIRGAFLLRWFWLPAFYGPTSRWNHQPYSDLTARWELWIQGKLTMQIQLIDKLKVYKQHCRI